jgi:ATPase family associated with various cellular activities (AAA)
VGDDLLDLGAFGASFSEFVERMNAVARGRESPLVARISEHLGVDPKQLPSTAAEFSITDRPNLQLALDAVLPDVEVLGFSTANPGYVMFGIGGLLSGHAMVGPVELGPVQYADVEVGDGRVVRCVSTGVFLASRDDAPVVLVLSGSERPFGPSVLRLDGMSPAEGVVSSLLADLRAAMREHNVYRAQVISLHGGEEQGAVHVRFHRLPRISRDAVVLPGGTVERLARHAIGVAEHARRLSAAGRQLKRGVLLHGPPGTGKTLTVNYLLGAMPGRTTVLLTGRSLGLIEPAVAIARELTPATVVLEDVDLVAAERTMPVGDTGILFELLNQMEGLDEDADLLFLLTTNRADLIEPALATRPGRVDLALEIPLPDEAARAQLVRLYAQDVPIDQRTEQDLVARTNGLSGAFIKELMRQAALRAALEDRPPTSGDATAALDELREERSTLTRRLLGQDADGANAPPSGAPPFPAMLHAFGALGIPLPPDDE